MMKLSAWIVAAVVVVLGSGGVIYDQRTPVEFKGGRMIPVNCDPKDKEPPPSAIRAGACMDPIIDLLWLRVDCSLSVARSMTDGRGAEHKIPSDRESATPNASVIGKVHTSHRVVVVPSNAAPYLPPGPKPAYRGKMKLSCGLLRNILPPFEIEAGPIPFEFIQ